MGFETQSRPSPVRKSAMVSPCPRERERRKTGRRGERGQRRKRGFIAKGLDLLKHFIAGKGVEGIDAAAKNKWREKWGRDMEYIQSGGR